MTLNHKGYTQIFSSHDSHIAHNVFVPESQKNDWLSLKNTHTGNYYKTSILRAVLRLAVGDKTVAPQATIGDFQFSYTTSPDRKNIYINLISMASTRGVTSRTPGVYQVGWEKGAWKIPEGATPTTAMELNHTWQHSHYAAISGKFEDKEKAGRMMGVHIEKAYFAGSNALGDIRQKENHFSLFWLNNEFTSKQHIQSLVSLIQQAQKQNANVQWLVHGEGCGTFAQALRFIKANPVASDLLTTQKGMKGQDVFFSNPRGRYTGQKDLEALCKSVGMTYAGLNANKNDILYNPDARTELIKEVLKAAGAVSFTGAGAHFAGEVGADTVQKLWQMASSSPEMGIGTALAIAGGVVVIAGKAAGLGAYFRNMKGAASSTFGSGNQGWAA